MAWGFAGALLTFSAVAAASLGLFVLPVALIVPAIMAKRVGPVRRGTAVAGALAGAAAVVLFVGVANLGSTPCPSSGSGAIGSGGFTGATSCGGFDPWPWLAVGFVLAGAALVAGCSANRCHPPPGRTRPDS